MQHTVINENFNSNRVMRAIFSWMGTFVEVDSMPGPLDVLCVSRFIVLTGAVSLSFTGDGSRDGAMSGGCASVVNRSLGTLFS